MDILLDLDTHDLVFVNGAVAITPEQRDSVAQKLKIKLLTFLGEWFLNTDDGIPYRERIFGKVKSKALVDAIFQEKILEEEGVLALTEFESTLNPDRTYVMNFRVRTTLDQITDVIEITAGV